MEAPKLIILLYSKFSQSSKEIRELLRLSNINFITQVCVDNKEVRERVKSSTKLKISFLPCFLLIYSGNVEKFEGAQAFVWINELISKTRPPQQSQPPNRLSTGRKKVEFEEDEPLEEEEEEAPVRKSKPKTSAKKGGKTNIEDLFGAEEETRPSSDARDRKKKLKAGKAFSEEDEDTRDLPDRNIPPSHVQSTEVNHQESIIARSQKLQRERDEINSSLNKQQMMGNRIMGGE